MEKKMIKGHVSSYYTANLYYQTKTGEIRIILLHGIIQYWMQLLAQVMGNFVRYQAVQCPQMKPSEKAFFPSKELTIIVFVIIDLEITFGSN